MLHVSEYRCRQARCAAAVFGTEPYLYPRTREGWKMLYRHRRMVRAIRHLPRHPRILTDATLEVWHRSDWRALSASSEIPGRNGRRQAEEDYRVWAFRYHLGTDVLHKALRTEYGGFNAELHDRFRRVILKEKV